MADRTKQIERILDRTGGVLRLKPNYVRRFYVDGGRLLGGKPGATFNPRDGLYKPERWIASCTVAHNPHPIQGEGLSLLAADGVRMTLAEALRLAGPRLLGERRYQAHGPEFRVLIKILDGYVPIVFHIHARDQDVRRYPKHFKGHRFGKDEAYHFLDRPKGKVPYTHVGLHPGTTVRDLKRAVAQGADALAELSPVVLQRFGEGLFVPAGTVHRPGTALTLEIQQPSDVYTLLEREMDGVRFSPRQMHPGFAKLEQAFKCIDFETCCQPDLIERFYLAPKLDRRTRQRGGCEEWIFPPTMTDKFSGKRVRVTKRFESHERQPYALLVWKGRGRLGKHRVRAGDEFFVSYEAARAGLLVENTGTEPMVLFKFFAQKV